MREFLAETLGFDDLAPHEGAVCLLAGNRVPITITRQIAEGSQGNIRAALADLEMWMG